MALPVVFRVVLVQVHRRLPAVNAMEVGFASHGIGVGFCGNAMEIGFASHGVGVGFCGLQWKFDSPVMGSGLVSVGYQTRFRLWFLWVIGRVFGVGLCGLMSDAFSALVSAIDNDINRFWSKKDLN
jgi:hypothetical protein